MRDDILCVGEILWDALPEGLFLGGAPFNVACHLHALDEDVAFASRVGDDVLGDEALRRVRARGLDPEWIQVDDERPTGFVRVELDTTGEPDYEIVEPAAWDAIALSESLQVRIDETAAVVFGSLAQRAPISRQTIQTLCEMAAVRVFDVNMRPPYVDRKRIEQSLLLADVVKLNDDELDRLRPWFDLPDETEAAMRALGTTFDCSAVCVTAGEAGARLWHDGEHSHHPGYDVTVVDAVGAGDAFLAALLSGLLAGRGGDDLLALANRLGAYVASHSGAFPDYAADTLDDIPDLPLSAASGGTCVQSSG